MQNRQNGRRRRGGSNNPRPMGQPMGGQGNNRLEVKVRGNANQLLEKYKTLARDSHQAGDRVAMEYYLQHADHYYRVLNDSRVRHEELRSRRNIFDPLDEDQPDTAHLEGDAGENVRQGDDQRDRPRVERQQRETRLDEGEVSRQTGPTREDGEEQGRRRPESGRQRRGAAADENVAAPAVDVQPDGETVTMSDGEAALVAFGGRPRRTTTRRTAAAEIAEPTEMEVVEEAAVSELSAEAEAVIAEAPKPRRRGRPRKVDTVAATES